MNCSSYYLTLTGCARAVLAGMAEGAKSIYFSKRYG